MNNAFEIIQLAAHPNWACREPATGGFPISVSFNFMRRVKEWAVEKRTRHRQEGSGVVGQQTIKMHRNFSFWPIDDLTINGLDGMLRHKPSKYGRMGHGSQPEGETRCVLLRFLWGFQRSS